MKKRNNNKGFSMAELLAVVAIIMALASVAFIYVQRHQRSMTRLEFDSIAKEVFIAAQNHLTMAESQGYLDESIQYGELDDQIPENDKKKVYFLVINAGGTSYGEAANLLLPYGAVDGNVLLGSILISYQPSTARVLDVFYSKPANGTALTLNGTAFDGTKEEYKKLMDSYRDDDSGSKAAQRQDYNGKVIGWYGDGDALPMGERLETPEIIIHNEEKLWVEVQDKNASKTDAAKASLQLTITGETSGVQKSIRLRVNGADQSSSDPRVDIDTTNPDSIFFKVVLDDITTSGMHFAQLEGKDSKKFTPGENIVVEAVAYNNEALTNIAYSGKNTTNSLFAEVQKRLKTGSTTENEYVALISNFRHFENLDINISDFKYNQAIKKVSNTGSTSTEYEIISKAEQTNNIVWSDTNSGNVKPFVQRIQALNGNSESVSIYAKGNETAVATNNCLYPVSPTYVLTYDGQNHSVSNVKVDYAGDAGLFGSLTVNNSSVKNLELIDFDIKGTTSAGALIGSAGESSKTVTVTNVVAHNSVGTDGKEKLSRNIEASGNAGGLIGTMTDATVEKSAAALYVKSTGGNAGGLIGTSSGGTVTASYSGGHTYSGAPETGTAAAKYSDPHTNVYPVRYYDANNAAMYNVTATTNAGGLIGSASSTAISYSYSTCSASAENAGGLVGTGTDNTIKYCYCTGLIPDQTNTIKTHGAFAGSLGGNQTIKGCKYFEIVNEYRETKDNKLTSGYRYLEKLGNSGTNAEITAFDASADSYNGFSPAKDEWGIAYPYDQGGNAEGTNGYGLKVFYKNGDKTGYNLQTVQQVIDAAKKVDSSITDTIKVETTDYVKDHYGDWPAPEEFIFVS